MKKKTENKPPNYGEDFYAHEHDGKSIYGSKPYKKYGYAYVVHWNDMFGELDHNEQKYILNID